MTEGLSVVVFHSGCSHSTGSNWTYLREQRLGVQLQLYTSTTGMECSFPHRLQGDLMAAYQHLKGGYKKAAEQHEFSRACCGQDKGEWL